MTQKIYLLFLLSFLTTLYGNGQTTAVIKGKVFNKGISRFIESNVNLIYLSGENKKYNEIVEPNGDFSFEVEVPKAQYISVQYNRKSDVVFIEPGDTLVLEFIAEEFPKGTIYSGECGVNNILYKKFLQQFAIETNRFKLLQFKDGVHWFVVSPKINDKMKSTPPPQFMEFMSERKEKMMKFLDDFASQYDGQITPAFNSFLATEIYYDWAYHMLMYAVVYKNKHMISDEFLDFLALVPTDNEYFGSFFFQKFLLHYNNYKAKQNQLTEGDFANQYLVATEVFSGEQLAYVQSEVLRIAIRKKKFDEIGHYYDAFLQQNLYPFYDDKISNAYQNYKKFAIGTNAPDFTIKDIENKQITKLDFQGKVIFLNFWASWCKPCIKKMNAIKPIENELKENGVVFINVSFDQDIEALVKALNAYSFTGIHVLETAGIESPLAKGYNVKALPQFFIIDKYGKFENSIGLADIKLLKEKLLELTKM